MRKNFIFLILTLLLSIPLVVLMTESPYKALFVLTLLLCWLLIGWKTKSYFKTTLLFIFIVLPFNITAQLPTSVYDIVISNPYVSGLWVNFLSSTLSITDLFVFLLIISGFFEARNLLGIIIKDPFLWIFLLLLLLQNLFVQEVLVFITSSRLLLYLLGGILTLKYLKERNLLRDLLQTRYVNLLLFSSLILQFFIGLYQFIRGSSVGLNFLGESHVVNGMLNSSFIEINGEIFLRAYGTFPHPNVLAGWTLFLFLISLFTFKKTSLLSYINILLIFGILSLTFSRVSILLLLLFVIIYTLNYLHLKKGLFSFTSLIWVRFTNLFNGDRSLKDRITLVKTNWELFKDNWLLGTGIGNSVRYYGENIPYTDHGRLLLQPVHNIFMLSFVEMGIVSGMSFWFLIYRYFIKGVKWGIKNIFIITFIVLVGMFDHYLLSLPQGLIILISSLLLLTYQE